MPNTISMLVSPKKMNSSSGKTPPSMIPRDWSGSIVHVPELIASESTTDR